jgi:hypothetical protein
LIPLLASVTTKSIHHKGAKSRKERRGMEQIPLITRTLGREEEEEEEKTVTTAD